MNFEKIKSNWLKLIKFDFFQELFFSGIGCIFFIFLFELFPKKFFFSLSSKTDKFAGIILAVIILSFFSIFIIFNQPDAKINFFKSSYKRNITLFSIFNFAIFYFLLYNTDFLFLGVYGDNWYRSAYITQMANSGYPQDYCYKGFSAYYYPFYYYILALSAKLFHRSPYKMLKFGFLFLCFLLPILVYESWKKIYDKKISFIIAVISLLILQNPYAIDHVLVYLVLIPFFLYYYENYTKKNFKLKNYIFAGLIGAILACTYLSYLLFIPIYYLIKIFQNKKEFLKNFKHIFYISLLIMLFSSWYWVPFLIEYYTKGFEVHQNNWFEVFMVDVPLFTQILSLSITGLILFLGFIFIVKKYKLAMDFKIFGNLIISLYIIIFVGFIAILLNSPFYLYYRFFEIPTYILIVSASIFYVKFFSYLYNNKTLKKSNLTKRIPHLEVTILIFFICGQNYLTINKFYCSSEYVMALNETKPTKDIEIFEKLDYEDKVFLTHKYKVACFIPIYLFISPYIHFSHPSALHNQRAEFLLDLSKCKTSKEFYNKLVDSKFGPIDFFYLKPKENSTAFEILVRYGDEYEQKEITLTFSSVLFKDPHLFEEIIISNEIIYKTVY